MKPIKSLLVIAVMLAPALASAQGYYGGGGYGPPPVPGGFHNRTGRLTWGFGVGIGGMSDSGGRIACDNCSYNPASLEIDGHIGGMLSPRLALMVEAQGNAQTLQLNGDGSTDTLTQSTLMGAVQFWVTPQFWIKGGLGFAHLDVSNDNYYGSIVSPVSDGFAVMGAAGFELMSARNFAIDLQARLIEGSYDGINDHVTSGTIGVGFDWY